jgi:pyruvate formate lyase activating enzyme
MFYKNTGKNNTVKCNLCPHHCLIPTGKTGICAVRKNINGKLFSLVYGKAIACHVDPIEKKPLFHFKPGSRIYSFATAGCNFRCDSPRFQREKTAG